MALALVSSLFILVLSITGIILAFEPVSNALIKNPTINKENNISIAQLYENIAPHYDEILKIEVDPSEHIIASVIENGKENTFYIHPLSGLKTGEIQKKAWIYSISTNLHRSLFLKTTGRLLIGIFSFLLFLISVTGFILFLKRQKGIRNFFGKLIKDNFFSYFHLQMSRVFIIPIILIALSGVYLSLLRFSLIPNPNEKADINLLDSSTNPEISPADFVVFQELKISSLKSINFPFFKDPSEFFQLSLKNRDLLINQYNGEIELETPNPKLAMFSIFILDLHTGRSSILWSIILGISAISILFFMYSGFAVSLKRRSGRIRNEYSKKESSVFIGVASENGSTLVFAKSFQKGLSKIGQKAHIFPLDHFEEFKKMQELVIFAASYGDGEAPSNSEKFLSKMETLSFKNSFNYSIVGFGSIAYPKFCGFAIDISNALKKIPYAKMNSDLFTINNQSFESFKNWCKEWTDQKGHPRLQLENPKPSSTINKTTSFAIINSKTQNERFIIEFNSTKTTKVSSGDLISVQVNKEEKPKLYSLATLKNGTLAIAVKKHEMGLCSTYLSQLKIASHFDGRIINNKKFHLPKTKKEILMIATGTGIMPLLGMIQNKKAKNKTFLYWGIKSPKSEELYSDILNPIKKEKQLSQFNIAYSQFQGKKEYVQDLLNRDQKQVSGLLKNGGVIMICGSVSMQSEVIKLLNQICLKFNSKPISFYENKGQLRMDCY